MRAEIRTKMLADVDLPRRDVGAVIERQTMGDSAQPVVVHSPTGVTSTVTLGRAGPGLWRATIDANEVGLWRADQGDKHAFASLGPPNPREFLDVRSTTERLAATVKASSGRIGRVADASGNITLPRIVPIRSGNTFNGSDWMGLRMSEASILKGIDRLPLFAGFLGLAILLGTLAATWYREGR